MELGDFTVQDLEGEEFLVVTLRTAKRGGLQRSVASSMRLDPLAEDVWEGVQHFEGPPGPLFSISPRTVERATAHTFWGLSYPIMSYKVSQERVDQHWRIFNVHALRHIRATELSQHYGFSGEDLARFLGWTMGSARLSNMIERYEMYSWKKYGQRLLIRPPWVPPRFTPDPKYIDNEESQDGQKDQSQHKDQDPQL